MALARRNPGGVDQLLDGRQVGLLGPLAVAGHLHVADECAINGLVGLVRVALMLGTLMALADLAEVDLAAVRAALDGRGRRRRGDGCHGDGVGGLGGRGVVAVLVHDTGTAGLRRGRAGPRRQNGRPLMRTALKIMVSSWMSVSSFLVDWHPVWHPLFRFHSAFVDL